MTALRFSVALATYNGEQFLPEQLDSLVRQSRRPDELVVTDDGSSDGTVEVVRHFARSAPFAVHVHANETRLGYGENFLKAASLCQGDLVAFCDQDDVWLAAKLGRMERALRRPGVLLACHDAELVDAKLAPLGATVRHPRRSPFDIVPGCTIAFRRELLEIPVDRRRDERLRSTEAEWQGLPHDRWLWFLASALDAVRRVASPLVRYRQHGRNVFGAGAPPSRWASLTTEAGRQYIVQSARAEAWSAFLADLAREVATPQQWREPLAVASQRCHALAQQLGVRARLYDPCRGITDRISAFATMLGGAAYRPGRLGRAALLKDAAIALLGPRRGPGERP